MGAWLMPPMLTPVVLRLPQALALTNKPQRAPAIRLAQRVARAASHKLLSVKTGSRFSTNARTPSRKSSLAGGIVIYLKLHHGLKVKIVAAQKRLFDEPDEDREFLLNFCATPCAVAISSSARHTCVTKPISPRGFGF